MQVFERCKLSYQSHITFAHTYKQIVCVNIFILFKGYFKKICYQTHASRRSADVYERKCNENIAQKAKKAIGANNMSHLNQTIGGLSKQDCSGT